MLRKYNTKMVDQVTKMPYNTYMNSKREPVMLDLQDMFAKENTRRFTVFSEQHCAKMSASLKGKSFTEQHRANISTALKGKSFTEQHRANMAVAQQNRKKRTQKTFGGRPANSIMTPEGKFDTVKSYAAYVGVALITVYKRIERFPDQYYFVEETV